MTSHGPSITDGLGSQNAYIRKTSLSSNYCLMIALMVFDTVRIIEFLVGACWTKCNFFDIFEIFLVVVVAYDARLSCSA